MKRRLLAHYLSVGNRPLAAILISLALSGAPCALAASGPAPAEAGAKPETTNEFDAHLLKVADSKLAGLAQEARPENSAGKEAKASAAKKKQTHTRKKRGARRHKAQANKDAAAQKILGRRLSESEVKRILGTTRDFSGTDLSGLNLVGMDLTGVKLNRANLHLANLERADLAESDLELADLTGANLRGASLNQARLRGARMEGSRMDGALWIDKTVCKSGSVGRCVE